MNLEIIELLIGKFFVAKRCKVGRRSHQLVVFSAFVLDRQCYQIGFDSQMARLFTFWLKNGDNVIDNTAGNT